MTYVEESLGRGSYRHHHLADIDPGATIGNDVFINMAWIGRAVIGDRTSIGNFTTVLADALISDDCELHNNVAIDKGVVIGSMAKIQDQVSISTGVTLGSCTFVGRGAQFPNDRYSRAYMPSKQRPETVVRLGASIGANATVVCGERYPTTIGEFSMISAGSTVTRSTIPFGLYVDDECRGWVNMTGDMISDDPRDPPPRTALLRGIDRIPDELRPDERAISEVMHYVRADLRS